MKREARLQKLISDMNAGRLSRNKHFDAYQRPEVANARGRRLRMERLLQMLDRAHEEHWCFSLKNGEAGTWLLECFSEKLNGTWSAHLFQFELDMLHNHPRGALLLNDTTTR